MLEKYMQRSYFLGKLHAYSLQLCSKNKSFECIWQDSWFGFADQLFCRRLLLTPKSLYKCYFFFPMFLWTFKISKQLFWILVLQCTCRLHQYLVHLLKIFKHLWKHCWEMGSYQAWLKLFRLWWSSKNVFLQLFFNSQSQKLILENIYQKSKSFKHLRKPWNKFLYVTVRKPKSACQLQVLKICKIQ